MSSQSERLNKHNRRRSATKQTRNQQPTIFMRKIPQFSKGTYSSSTGTTTTTMIKAYMALIGMVMQYIKWNGTKSYTYHLQYHIPYQMHKPDKRYVLKLGFIWKTLLNMSQCTTKPTNDVCHVETLIRLQCKKYSVIK